jgi:hypothetical protein
VPSHSLHGSRRCVGCTGRLFFRNKIPMLRTEQKRKTRQEDAVSIRAILPGNRFQFENPTILLH